MAIKRNVFSLPVSINDCYYPYLQYYYSIQYLDTSISKGVISGDSTCQKRLSKKELTLAGWRKHLPCAG